MVFIKNPKGSFCLPLNVDLKKPDFHKRLHLKIRKSVSGQVHLRFSIFDFMKIYYRV